MALTVENLTCHRGLRTVLDNVSFTVPSGHALLLTGPNGSGKSTLLRCMAGLMPLSKGTRNYATEDTAYFGHQDAIKAQLTVFENLTFWSQVYGGSDVELALKCLDLTSLMDRLCFTLSAGQKRRLSLARLSLCKAPIWLLDEPTTSLDQETSSKVEHLLKDHLKQGGTVIAATHLPLNLDPSQSLDMTHFAAANTPSIDPFLEGSL